MWYDNETDCDFLNFESIARTVSEIIVQSKGQPVSIGVSGAWGVGKSSMIRLINKDLASRNSDSHEFVFVEFNAWLYQGYDDARAALLDVIAQTLKKEAESNKGAKEKILVFLGKVDWIRLVSIGAQAALFTSLGLPPVGILGQSIGLFKSLLLGKRDKETADEIAADAKSLGDSAKGLLKDEEITRPPQEIQELRNSFAEALKALNKTLVVFIDDLDRCLPETTISTLEAIRLFLFLERTAFVIAADSQVIRHAVKKHFNETENSKIVTSYFDKLIQIPIQVPPLGTQEVRAYLILLHVYQFVKDPKVREEIRTEVRDQLAKSWEGRRIDQHFVEAFKEKLDPVDMEKIRNATRLAHLLTTATDIAGNPRLIKRFLNALSIRQAVADAQGITIDPQALAKILLLERCGSQAAYKQLVSEITKSDAGKLSFLKKSESNILNGGEIIDLSDDWKSDFIKEWLELPPQIADLDLRRELYVSRESAAIISPQDRLSSEGAELLTAFIEHPKEASSFVDELKKISKNDMVVIFDKLIEKASRISDWGIPDILDPLVICVTVDPSQGSQLGNFFAGLKANQIKPSIVARIQDYDWARPALDKWSKDELISGPVKKAIKSRRSTDAIKSVKAPKLPEEY